MEPISQATPVLKLALLGFSLLTGGPPMQLAQMAALIAADQPAGSAEIAQGNPAPAPAPLQAAPAPTPSPAPTPAPAPAKSLKGLAAWGTLVGNTVAGKSDDDDLFEYYSKNGTAKQLIAGQKATGKWSLRGEVVCFDYNTGDGETCYSISVTGSQATFTDEDDNESVYQIMPGNPKKL